MRDELVKLQKDVQDWSIEDLKFANEIIVAAVKDKYSEKARDFHVGQKVEFHSSRFGENIQGTISKINRRSITVVNCSDGRSGWRVGPTQLKAIA